MAESSSLIHDGNHDSYRIALYYCYIPIPDVQVYIAFHNKFDDCFGGRVRVASEGLNGVLSGRFELLKQYEEQLWCLIHETCGENNFDLDVKYCRLRPELPVSKQLFYSLQVQKTNQVVGLVEPIRTTEKKKKKGYSASRREKRKEERCDDQTILEIFQQSLSASKSAPHLSPQEWNAKLREITESKSKVVILDCRNSYESNIGHFRVDKATTVLTNTRKYSDLPKVLLHQKEKLQDASHIFMYCTGGVRCERASSFLQTMLNDGNVTNTEIYQLHGGIQRYLEQPESDLYKGKNFVFDPRRTDPNHNGTVGRCLVCNNPHDDYDNGQSVCSEREARCCKCRILILVCDECRKCIRVWGQEENGNPKLYCGGLGATCLHQLPVQELSGGGSGD